jgi:hypothetical protein
MIYGPMAFLREKLSQTISTGHVPEQVFRCRIDRPGSSTSSVLFALTLSPPSYCQMVGCCSVPDSRPFPQRHGRRCLICAFHQDGRFHSGSQDLHNSHSTPDEFLSSFLSQCRNRWLRDHRCPMALMIHLPRPALERYLQPAVHANSAKQRQSLVFLPFTDL